jgi:hypothetical protein
MGWEIGDIPHFVVTIAQARAAQTHRSIVTAK